MLRPWVPNLIIRPDGRGKLSLRIAQAIIEEIQRGRLVAGDSLPGTRDFARELNINRKTVVVAYEELAAQGWVKSDSRRGTFISKSISDAAAGLSLPRTAIASGLPSRGRRFNPPPPWPKRNEIGFDDGVPDQRLIPTDAIAQAYAGAARAAARQKLLGYGDPRGTDQLRHSIAKMLNVTRGLGVSTENICVTRGSQMALYVIAQTIVAPDDTVIFEELSYPPAVQAFRLAGAQISAVKLGPDGIDLDHLEVICRRQRVRAVYLTPGHQFPTTVVLRPSARLRLRALAAQFGFFVVEDDYDHEFHFDHQPMLPLASNDPAGQIIYVGSFSKVLSPSLRVGYIAGPPSLIAQIGDCIGTIDRQGDPIIELAIVELIESGHLRRHIKRVHAIFNGRRTDFATSLARQLEGLATFDVPSGGLAFWVRFADETDLSELARVWHPGTPRVLTSKECSVSNHSKPAARLGFAGLNEREVQICLAHLSEALRLSVRRA